MTGLVTAISGGIKCRAAAAQVPGEQTEARRKSGRASVRELGAQKGAHGDGVTCTAFAASRGGS